MRNALYFNPPQVSCSACATPALSRLAIPRLFAPARRNPNASGISSCNSAFRVTRLGTRAFSRLGCVEGVETEVNLARRRGESVAAQRGGRHQEVDCEGGESEESLVATMADLLDLEKQFSFYGAYHSNSVNIFIHILFVWPIFFTSLILWAYTPAIVPLPLAGGTLPLQQYMVLNVSFVIAGLYAVYYAALDKKAGSLGAALCLGCWIGANVVAQALPWSVGWKVVLLAQLVCWIAQIAGHAVFEGRAPALVDNVFQAFLMAPFFVLLECLCVFGYEPYPGFRKSVEAKSAADIAKFRASKVTTPVEFPRLLQDSDSEK